MRKTLLSVAIPLVATACSSGVKPIGLHDSNVPLDARRFVADAQDAVSIARARRDDAATQLKATQTWRTELTNTEMWPKGSEALLSKLEAFADARVTMSKLMFDRAELQLDLAKAKYELSTAETAMRNDIAVYDLEPLRGNADAIRRNIEKASVAVEEQRTRMDKLTVDWWDSYGKFTQSGKDTPVFYISPEILTSAKARDERLKADRKAKAKAAPEATDDKANGRDSKVEKKDEKAGEQLQLDL